MQKLLALLRKPIPHTPKPGVLVAFGLLVFAVCCFVARLGAWGENLVTNGTFGSDVSGWTSFMDEINWSSGVGNPAGSLYGRPASWPFRIYQQVYFSSTIPGWRFEIDVYRDSDAYQVPDLLFEVNVCPTWDCAGNELRRFVWPQSSIPLDTWTHLTWECTDPLYHESCPTVGGDGYWVGDWSVARTSLFLRIMEQYGMAGGPFYIDNVKFGVFPAGAPPAPLSGCFAPPDGGFDAVPITSTWFCTTELGQTEHSLFVEPDGITDNTLYWLQDMRFNYPVGEGCYKVGTASTFQITQTGWYTFTLDYSLVPGIEGINALWTTAGLIANFPGGPNGPDSQFWTGRLVALDGMTTTIIGSQYFSQTGPYNLFFQFIPRRDPFLDGPGTDVIYIDNACIRNQPDATPTPTITPTPTNTPTPTPTGTITATETSTPTSTPTSWAGPPPTATPTVPGGTPGPTATPQPPQQAGFCDSTTAPTFPPDDGSCGPDVSFLTDPLGWARQQLCKLVSLFPRSFTWMGWFLQWLFCPILDVIGGLLCALSVVVPMIQSFLNLVTWIWNFIIAAFTAFNFEKNKPVTVFSDFIGGWIWTELTDVIAKLKATTFFGWLFDWFIRALLWWNTFIWFMSIAASGAGESSTEAQDSEGE